MANHPRTVVIALALLAVVVNTAAAADVASSLKAKGFNSFAALLDVANMTKALNQPAAVYTVLAPSDAAIAAFLKTMGLTLDDLKARPLLAKKIVAQHLILKHNVREQELFDQGNSRIVDTLAGRPNELLFRKVAGGAVTVSDFQGNTAKVQKGLIQIDDNKTAHPIDKVLFSDQYYPDFVTLCAQRKLTLSDFCKTAVYADLKGTLNARDFANTVFVPNNVAFTKLKLGSGKVPTVAQVQDVLKFHVVPGVQTLPGGFKKGQSVKTLQGDTLKVEYTKVTPAAGSSRTRPYANATIITSAGQQVPVIRSNIFVGKAVVHGIDQILQPGTNAAAAAKPAAAANSTKAPAAATNTTKPAAAPAAAAAARPAAAAAATAPAKAGGRRMLTVRSLLGWGWGFSGGPTAEMDNAEAAIDAAASGDEPVYDATQQSLGGAEALSVPGEYNMVEDGLNDW